MGFFDRFRKSANDPTTRPIGPSGAPSSTGGRPTAGFAVIDVETTGLSAHSDRILELAVVRTDPTGTIVDEWVQRFNPEGPIGATHIHGISANDVANEPKFSDLITDVSQRMRGAVAVAHNAKFDLAFLRSEYTRAGWSLPRLPTLCTLDASAHYLPHMDRRRLSDCCQAAGVPHLGQHSALGDARAAAELLAYYLHPRRGPRPHPEHLNLLDQSAAITWPDKPSHAPRPPATHAHVSRRIAIAVSAPPAPALLSLLADFSLIDAVDEGAPATALSYLELLANALEDGELSGGERDALAELARTHDLTTEDVAAANRALLLALAHLAVDDGKVTRSERAELQKVADTLALPDSLIKQVLAEAELSRTARLNANLLPLPTDWTHGEPLRVGDKIAFTGGEPTQRAELERQAERLGVRVMNNVSSKTAVLVTDGDFEGTKAHAARDVGCRVVSSAQFSELLRHLQPAPERTRQRAPRAAALPIAAADLVAPEVAEADSTARADASTVREWARANGYTVGARGRIHADIWTAHARAAGEDVDDATGHATGSSAGGAPTSVGHESSSSSTTNSAVQLAGTTTLGRDAIAALTRRLQLTGHGYAELTGTVQREPHNPVDPQAIAVHVEGERVGYLPGYVAARHALSEDGAQEVLVQIFSEELPAGLRVEAWAWLGAGPPEWTWSERSRPPMSSSAKAQTRHVETSAMVEDALAGGGQRASDFRAGLVNGVHYLQLIEPIKQLKREGNLDRALELCYAAIEGAEGDRSGREPAPWYTEQAAIIHRKLGQHEEERAVLDRWLEVCPPERRSGSSIAARRESLP